jgi:hypothetical protein
MLDEYAFDWAKAKLAKRVVVKDTISEFGQEQHSKYSVW